MGLALYFYWTVRHKAAQNLQHNNKLHLCQHTTHLSFINLTAHLSLPLSLSYWKVRTSISSTSTNQQIDIQKSNKYLLFHVFNEVGIR